MRFRYLSKNKKNVEVQNNKGESFFFPSALHPLSNKNLELFTCNTSTRLSEEEIAEVSNIVNQIDTKVGYCYSNCEKFLSKHAELKSNIKVQSFTGWLILSNDKPIHHCWIVVNRNQILDFSISESNFEFHLKIAHLPIEKQRKLLLSEMLADDSKQNSEKMLLGAVPEGVIYIGSKSTPNMGRIIYNKAKAANPKENYDNDIFSNPNHLQRQYFNRKLK